MLHVSAVCPAALTAQVVSRLVAAPRVENLVVQPGAGRRPDGDAISFDVHESTANRMFSEMRRLGLDENGAIAVAQLDAALTAHAPPSPAERRKVRVLRREAAPVWELVTARIESGSRYAPSFYLLLMLAGLIGAVGLLTNSSILIVGAMVVGPEYAAIIAVALGMTRRDQRGVMSGLAALGAGFGAAIVATLVFGLVIRASGATPKPFVTGLRPVADFVNSPDVFSAIVAVLAGIVGVVSLTEAKASALIGVFISVTTIPAAASIGISIAYSLWGDAGGSALQLLLNVIVLIIVGYAGLTAQRWFWRRQPTSQWEAMEHPS
ncbi:MAG TPA: DUF389 domain-containing protein [Streptosporangiaceae bacterium]|jgi:uncharacterized hydrophobic protein (TIGR00271 family)|nr:DUF389 domain-containing protein [Streptosporangiaceae bacterium]